MQSILTGLLLSFSLYCAAHGPRIESVDCSFFPKVSIVVTAAGLQKGSIKLLEDGRRIRTFSFSSFPGNRFKISFLSSTGTFGRHRLELLSSCGKATAMYRSLSGHRLGRQGRPCLKLFVTGPKETPVPCRFVAINAGGELFEDRTSADGLGRLHTGKSIRPGSYYVELRLDGLDLSIEHFPVKVLECGPTVIYRRLGFLRLPRFDDPRNWQFEIARSGKGHPILRANLDLVLSKLPPRLPPMVIPLPPGKYRYRFLPAETAMPSGEKSCGGPAEIFAGQYTSIPSDGLCR